MTAIETKYAFILMDSLWVSHSSVHTGNISPTLNLVFLFVIVFLLRRKCILTSCLQSVTICSDFGAQENKMCHCFHCFPIYLTWSDGIRWHEQWNITHSQKEQNWVICRNIDGPRDYHTKWSKSSRIFSWRNWPEMTRTLIYCLAQPLNVVIPEKNKPLATTMFLRLRISQEEFELP